MHGSIDAQGCTTLESELEGKGLLFVGAATAKQSQRQRAMRTTLANMVRRNNYKQFVGNAYKPHSGYLPTPVK